MSIPKRASFQFSLRELLLAMTAIAALLGLLLQNIHRWTPLPRTPLTEDFSLSSVVNQIAASRGLGRQVSASGGTGSSGGGESSSVSSTYGFRIPAKDRKPIFDELAAQIRAVLTEQSCRVDGGGSGQGNFYWRYHSHSLNGIVKLEMRDDTDPAYVVISYFAVEFKK